MPYILPKVEVDQQFTQVPVFAAQPLSALVIGPQYQLFRNDEASEKALILESNGDTAYYSGSETAYTYPGSRPATSVVDLAWDKTEVLFENVLGKYFPNTDLGSTGTYTTTAVAGSNYKLQLLSGGTGIQLKTVGTTTRASFLSNRDVQAGDYAYVSGSGGTPVMTKIVAVRQEATLASTGTVTTSGTVTDVTNTKGGAFVGTKDAVYCLKITKAGPWYEVGVNEATAAKARITSTNADSSAEFYVGKGVDFAFDLGSSGVTLSLAGSATSLALNAAWYVPMTAAGLGAASIIEVADDIAGVTGTVAVALYAKASSYVVPQAKDLVGNVNWNLDSANVTMHAGISLLIPTLLTTAAEMAPLPISTVVNYEPTMYIQYRALLKDNTTSLSSLTDPAEVAAVLGPINLDNPLSQGVYDALLNSGGTPVYYAGVATDDLDGYNTALDLATQSDAVYSTVPLTFNTEVQTAVEAHTNAMSAAGEAKWRIAWISKPLTTSALVLDLSSAGADSLAYASAGTVTFTGVALHDIARVGDDVLLYDFAAGSSSAFSTGTITEIAGNTVAKVSPAFGDIAQGHPVKVQIRRNYTKNEQIANLAASNTSNRRVRTIFPDIQRIGSVEKPGYFTAAALAGLRSSVVPHQGLTNTEVLGVVGLDRALYEFSSTQLNTLAAAGFWIVTQAGIGGTAYVRHQLTSDMSSLNKSEDSVTANVDSISYGIQRALAPFIGKYNVTPFNLLALRKVVEGELNFRKLSTYTVSAGNQLIDYAITKLEQNATFKDRVDITVSLTVPYPMNNINLTFIV